MSTYCHMSKKYILYFFQKRLVCIIILLIMGFCTNLQGQKIDTLNTSRFKKILKSKNKYNNDWNFEEDDDFRLDQKKHASLKNEFELGALLYTENKINRGHLEIIKAPFNQHNSAQIGIKKYIKTIESPKKYFNFQLGIGTTFHHLNLGKNEAIVLDDTITFFKSSKEIRKNFMRFHYLTVPLKLNFKPISSKKKTFQIGASIQYHLLIKSKYELKFKELNNSKKISTLGNLHHRNHFISSRIQLSYKKIGVYVENGITSISTIFQSPYSLSFGIVLCSYH